MPRQKFEGHTGSARGVIHLPDGQRIMTCSVDGSLRVWNLKSGKQIGEDWRDGEGQLYRIALSLNGKKVVSGGEDGAVRLWDIDAGKVIAEWTGHTKRVVSVCWSRDGRRVLSGSNDGTARQWDVESRETILKPIVTGHSLVWAVVYSPDTTLIATGGRDGPPTGQPESLVKIWNAKTGELVATLKGHTDSVYALAWTKDGKTLISGSFDYSIRTWDTSKWKQTAVLKAHTFYIHAISISPNDRILASASYDNTARLWNLDNGQPIGLPLWHSESVEYVSFSQDGELLATACRDGNAYTWDVAAILREAGLDDLLSDRKANKSALRSSATRRPPAYQIPRGFFDGVSQDRSQLSAQSCHSSSELQGSTLLRRLFHRSPSNARDTSPSSPLKWAQALLKRRGESGESTELHERSQGVEVPYAKGKRRNASAREVALAKQKQKMKALHSKNSTESDKPNVTKPSLQQHAAGSSSSTTPAVGDNAAATSSTASRPDVMLRQAGLWTRFWLFIGCLSPEYLDGRH